MTRTLIATLESKIETLSEIQLIEIIHTNSMTMKTESIIACTLAERELRRRLSDDQFAQLKKDVEEKLLSDGHSLTSNIRLRRKSMGLSL